jgi:hypothetical protein
LIVGNGTNSATRLGIGTNGYVLTVSGGTAVWAASTGGVTSFQTSLSGLTPNTATTGAVTLAGTLGATSGGTGLAAYTTGDILYSSATNTLAKLGIGTTGQVLSVSAGGVPTWSTASSVTPSTPLNSIQFNNASAFGGSANLIWDNTNGLLGIGGTPTASKGTLQVGTIGYTDTGVIAGFASSTAGYNQIVLQNTSSNAAASANLNVSNDAGTSTTNFGEFGINSSTFMGTGSFSTAGYTYLASASTDLAIGTYGSNKIHFVVNSGATDAAVFDTSGNFGIGQATPGSKLDVKGTLRLSGATSGYVGLAPAAAAGSTTYTLPAADGTSGQFLKTDGAATLSWATASGGGGPVLESYQTISSNYSVTAGSNAFSVGPVTVATGVAVTVPTGQVWLIAA